MDTPDFNAELLRFLDQSPTPFHAVSGMRERLVSAGFVQLDEAQSWTLERGRAYVVIRNDSSLVAFYTGAGDLSPGQLAATKGWRMVGAHTDSPCLKVKPVPDIDACGTAQLGVEVYGGALLAPWFDRDLSLAGRVTYVNTCGGLESALVDFGRPLARIPSLAIHLDRKANEHRSINRQKELNLVLGSGADSFAQLLASQLREQYPDSCQDLEASRVADWEISAYDTQAAALTGLHHEFIASARLDNLLSCFTGAQAVLECRGDQPALLVCTDHEEVGSQSACGAQGPFLRDVLQRIIGEEAHLVQALCNSMMISADNAHAVHPNYPDRHDASHGPALNAGPVIKINANQRYATNSETAARFRAICAAEHVPVQTFVSRNDLACGSTVGPITAGELGVPTLDIGCPQWAMHSIRETAGADDAHYLKRALVAFYNHPKSLKIQ